MPRQSANCYIVAGPNGAGKTTFATEFLPHYANCRNFVNPDLLARAFSPFDPDAGMLHAGRTVLEGIEESPRLIFKEEAGKTTIEDAALYEYLRGQFEV
jgi:predicted ABC-type ATPase